MLSVYEQQAADLRPLLATMVAETEILRRIPDEIQNALEETDLFRLYQPREFGGLQLTYGILQLSISTLLGSACASTAWVQAGLSVHAWMVAQFAKVAQEAVWGNSPHALICTAVSPKDGTAERVDGGYILNGTWQFSSGCHACDWTIVRGVAPDPGERPSPRLFLFRKSDAIVTDVWRSVGLKGTGSNDISVERLFVPNDFTLDVLALRGENRTSPALYGLPYLSLFPFTVGAPALGAARGALDWFLDHGKDSPEWSAASVRLQKFSIAAAEVDMAEHLLRDAALLMESAVAANARMSSLDRVRCRRNISVAAHLCRKAVNRLVSVLGAHGVHDTHPVHIAHRDLIAITSHVGLNQESAAEVYSRVCFGLPVNDPFV